jgi:exonuclease SbcD
MRFLHTSDWHVGKMLRGRSRLDEHESVHSEIMQIAIREQVDCVFMTGDLFDSYAPSPDAERLVYNFFAELVSRGIVAVVIGGNHDHPKRLAAVRQLVDRLGIYVRPEPISPKSGGIVEVRKEGQLARIAVLPFVPEKKIVDVCRMMEPERTWYSEYAECVGQMCEVLSSSFSVETINILLAHIYVHGAQTSGSEREIHIAQPYAISSQRFPSTAHYIGLGHLHRPQEVSAPSPCRYAGSPLQLDFGEHGQVKSIVVIDAQAGKPANVEVIELKSGRNLRDIVGSLEELQGQSQEYGDDFLRVTVKTAGPVPGIADRVREILPNALDIRIDYPRSQTAARSRKQMPPEALFQEFYHLQHGVAAPEALITAFRDLYEEATSASD